MARPPPDWVEFAAHDLAGVAAAMREGARIPLPAYLALQTAVAAGAFVELVMDRAGGVAMAYGPRRRLPRDVAGVLRGGGWTRGREPRVGETFALVFEVETRRHNPATQPAMLYVTHDLKGNVLLALEYAGNRAAIETQRISTTSKNLLVQYASRSGDESFYLYGWLKPSGDVVWAGARRRSSALIAHEVPPDVVLDADGALIDWLLEQYFAGFGDRPGTYTVHDPPRSRNPHRGR